MPGTLLQYFYVLIGLIYLQMEKFKRDKFKKDMKPVAFRFFYLSISSTTLNMLKVIMIKKKKTTIYQMHTKCK